jgi:hypothetical protein
MRVTKDYPAEGNVKPQNFQWRNSVTMVLCSNGNIKEKYLKKTATY